MVRGAIVATAILAAAEAAQVNLLSKHLRPAAAEDNLVEPIRFNQQLLICNAYPSREPVSVKKNSHESLEGGDVIPFRQCRYLQGQVEKKDQLEFSVQDIEMHGTFEVGELPSSDAILLLVVEKRANSPMVAFQSFAFPSSGERKEAQIAVINALEGNAGAVPKLTMEDHIEAKESQTVSKRIEQLSFNRVYSVEEGKYDASIAENSKQVVKLVKNKNYVLLRTGGNGFDESLVVFPSAVPEKEPPKTSVLEWVQGFVHTSFAHFFSK